MVCVLGGETGSLGREAQVWSLWLLLPDARYTRNQWGRRQQTLHPIVAYEREKTK